MSFASTSSSISGKLPLYDILREKLTQQNQLQPIIVGEDYISRLTEVLASVDTQRSEQVALLLIHYHFSVNNQPLEAPNLPYGIKLSSSGKGLSLDASLVPIPLLALIGTYCGI